MSRLSQALILGLTVLCVVPTTAPARPRHLEWVKSRAEKLLPWTDFMDEASLKTGLPEAWIGSVILAESGGKAELNGKPITSRKGAMGLMQLMPATYAEMKFDLKLGANAYDPHDNILAGATYLRAMFNRYGYPGMFAAYNAGPGRYEASLRGKNLPAETRVYVSEVTQKSAKTDQWAAIFVGLTTSAPLSEKPTSSTLFVPLSVPNADQNGTLAPDLASSTR